MRTKLFLAFFLVILTVLGSNLLFGRLIITDFADYVRGIREDHLYWVLASVEGSYTEQGWRAHSLRDALRWAVMLGLECVLTDVKGNVILTSRDALVGLPEPMLRRMQTLELRSEPVQYEAYPLYSRGQEIGTLLVRPLRAEASALRQKEQIFKERGRQFLLISFLIAGGGALFLALMLSLYLSRPIRRLKEAALAVARGQLEVRLPEGTDELGRLQQAFNHMVESLKREEALRRHLTSNIAHELRTPLTVLEAHLEAMADGVLEPTQENLASLRAELKSLTRLIEGIEDLTKAEASFIRLGPPQKIDLREFLEGIRQGMEPLFKEKGLYLRLAPLPQLQVHTEPEKLEKILRNILQNALQHTSHGGVELSCYKDGNMFVLQVSDTGPGIPPEVLPHVFERFYRGRGSRGFGLGLAIAQELAQTLGGKIEAESTPRKGSTFRISLPLRAPLST